MASFTRPSHILQAKSMAPSSSGRSDGTPARPAPGTRTWRVRTFRQWHRWLGAGAGLFLLWAGSTGTLVAFTEFFGEEEQIREATRDLVSPMSVDAPAEQWQGPLKRALSAVGAQAPGAPIDKIMIEFKGDAPRIQIFTGKPTGGEDRRFVVDANTGTVSSVETYADKPFLYRLHSGEAFGDGGLVVAMFWGLALVLMASSGLWIYMSMRRPGGEGLRKVFW